MHWLLYKFQVKFFDLDFVYSGQRSDHTKLKSNDIIVLTRFLYRGNLWLRFSPTHFYDSGRSQIYFLPNPHPLPKKLRFLITMASQLLSNDNRTPVNTRPMGRLSRQITIANNVSSAREVLSEAGYDHGDTVMRLRSDIRADRNNRSVGRRRYYPETNPNANARHWGFVVNNWTEDDECMLIRFQQDGEACYLVYGYERAPSTGTPHLQGYISFAPGKRRFHWIRKRMNGRGHWWVAFRSAEENRAYAMKDGDFREFGRMPKTSTKGKRNDIEAFKDAVKSGVHNMRQLREEHSNICAKFPGYVSSYVNDRVSMGIKVPSYQLYQWQADLHRKLILSPDPRKITFVVDPVGNKGKTWYALYYCQLHDNAQVLVMGPQRDMAHVLNVTSRVVFVDCTRSKVELLNYDFLENVKNGYVFSPKYDSHIKRMLTPHLVVMMNQMPDMARLSPDRYDIVELGNGSAAPAADYDDIDLAADEQLEPDNLALGNGPAVQDPPALDWENYSDHEDDEVEGLALLGSQDNPIEIDDF